MFGIGIVGLPNVGKSTLFNAITNSKSAEAENYPFCTIEPNIGVVDLPDSRLDTLARMNKSKKVVRSSVKFIDIAGLVKGASKGEGRGNKFLSNIRDAAAICHVIRCFDDDSVIHVDNSVDPKRDFDTINYELILSDLSILTRALDRHSKLARTSNESKALVEILKRAINNLEDKETLTNISNEDKIALKAYNLISLKPMILVANVKENDLQNGNEHSEALSKLAAERGMSLIIASSKTEYEIAMLPEEDRALFLEELGVEESSLDKLIRESYSILGLISFFTSGPQESRSWTIPNGESAYEAASKIHDDIKRGFIRAEVTSYSDFISTEGRAKERGLLRLEGREYIVKDGDIIYFRFNV